MAAVTYPEKRTRWEDLVRKSPNEKECMAFFIALEPAEILEGPKPATLISIQNRTRKCGTNLYDLWQRYGRSLARESGLQVEELSCGDDSILLMFYHSDRLRSLLARRSVGVILKRLGYDEPSDITKALSHLKSRLSQESFPHEIGIFLGYPLKDVIGFMGWAPLPFSCQGPWKIYGNPTESLKLAGTFRECRCRMAELLSSCDDPCQVLRSKAA